MPRACHPRTPRPAQCEQRAGRAAAAQETHPGLLAALLHSLHPAHQLLEVVGRVEQLLEGSKLGERVALALAVAELQVQLVQLLLCGRGHQLQHVLGLRRQGGLHGGRRAGTGSRSTEIHALSARANYQQWALQTGTALHETDSSWTFALAANLDLYAIKTRNTGSRSTELHVLSSASGYRSFVLNTGTGMHEV